MHNNYPSIGIKNISSRIGYNSSPEFQPNDITGVNHQMTRLLQMGGRLQQNRMIRDKRRSLDKALLYSYQAGFVKKYAVDSLTPVNEQPPVRALINPNKNKPDYDDKIISIGWEHDFHTGDIFFWENTQTYWLIYLQDLTELAYFRGDIRRCRYIIEWEDEDGDLHSTYAAVRGPVETKINFIQKHQISVDQPNHSLSILMPLNIETEKYFKRYSKFYLQDNDICWRVEAVDSISTPNILEVIAVEYYSNQFEDDIATGIAGGLIVKDLVNNTERVERLIQGESIIYPKRIYKYIYTGLNQRGINWEIDSSLPISYEIQEDKSINLCWNASYSGDFILKNGDFEKHIVVKSLF